MVFTGIVQRVATAKFDFGSNKLFLTVDEEYWKKSDQGDSVSVNGVCLTLLEKPKSPTAEFFVMEETRKKTNLAQYDNHEEFFVNVEHALRVGDSLGGHTVTGHVDGVSQVVDVVQRADGSRDVWIDLGKFDPSAVHAVHKGSICLDGISLTVAEIKGSLLRVSLIVYTLNHTTLQYRKIGDRINVEFDQTLKSMRNHHNNTPYNNNSLLNNNNNEWSQRLTDEEWMTRAITLGEKGKTTAPPNPWVASVIVNKNGQLIGQGYHQKAGQPHAEVNAVQDAIQNGHEEELAGSTVYVTLEPCHHFGRTPPCDQLLISKKVGRVVVAIEDPDSRVKSQGIQALRDAGIQVDVGVCEESARESLHSYLYHRSHNNTPYVVAKVALSMDGKIACEDGTSQWITSEIARADVHKLRAESQAIVVGIETALIDKPKLNVRIPEMSTVSPLRVVLDTNGRLTDGPLLDTSIGRTLIFTSSNVSSATVQIWNNAGVEHKIISIDSQTGRLDFKAVLNELGSRGILQVMVEGGAKLHSSLLQQKLVNRLVVYQGACIIGSSGKSWLSETMANTMKDVSFWKLTSVRQFGNDVRSEYESSV